MFFLRSLSLALLSMALISCATTSGSNKNGEQEIAVYLLANKNINKDIYDIPSPTRLTFLQLATVVEFDQMNEISTNGDTYKVHLGDSVLDEINVTINPKENIDFKVSLKKETKYLGVIGAFRDTSSDWKLSLERQEPSRLQQDVSFLYIGVRETDIVQLSKDETILKIATKALEDKGRDINKLTELEQKKLLQKTGGNLKNKKKANISKGLFSSAHEPDINISTNESQPKKDPNIQADIDVAEEQVKKLTSPKISDSKTNSSEIKKGNHKEEKIDSSIEKVIQKNPIDVSESNIENNELKSNSDNINKTKISESNLKHSDLDTQELQEVPNSVLTPLEAAVDDGVSNDNDTY